MSNFSYSIPDVGRKKIQLRIPESHTLYVCPQSCSRRQALRALRNGEAEHSSFLKLSQADLVSGDYEGEVARAIEQLLEVLPSTPRAFQIIVHCIDDFVGTDGENLVAGLRAQFPQVRFALLRENPISVDVETNPMNKMHGGVYALLEPPVGHDAGVNVIGSFEPLPDESELTAVLAAVGAGPLRHLLTCANFDEYQCMAASAVNLCVGRMGDAVAQIMEARFGIVPVMWHTTYSLDEVARNYENLLAAYRSSASPRASFDDAADKQANDVLAAARRRAESAVARALDAVGEREVVVDSSATFNPCDVARELAEYGFNVRVVLAFHMKGAEHDQAERLHAAFPQVEVITNQSGVALRSNGVGEGSLSVGVDGAFLFGAQAVVRDIYHDEGFFGYQGIERLMDLMTQAVGGSAGERPSAKPKVCGSAGERPTAKPKACVAAEVPPAAKAVE